MDQPLWRPRTTYYRALGRCLPQRGTKTMVIADFTVIFTVLVLQFIAGEIAVGLIGRILQGGGFGLIDDLLFGLIGAIGANFVVSTFNLSTVAQMACLVNSSLPALEPSSWW